MKRRSRLDPSQSPLDSKWKTETGHPLRSYRGMPFQLGTVQHPDQAMSSTHPNLTLVPAFAPEDARVRATRQLAETRRRIALENRLASGSSHFDASALEEIASPHLVLAGRIAASLDGAVLPPERRQDLLRFSKSIGVREFDASLVIAVIQDRARRGEPNGRHRRPARDHLRPRTIVGTWKSRIRDAGCRTRHRHRDWPRSSSNGSPPAEPRTAHSTSDSTCIGRCVIHIIRRTRRFTLRAVIPDFFDAELLRAPSPPPGSTDSSSTGSSVQHASDSSNVAITIGDRQIEMKQRCQRRLLFGLFLVRPPASPELPASGGHAHFEALRVIRTAFVQDQIRRRPEALPLERPAGERT